MGTNGGFFGSKTYGDANAVFRPFAEAEAICGNIRGHLTSGIFSQRSNSTGKVHRFEALYYKVALFNPRNF
jgi:hypothetical protein